MLYLYALCHKYIMSRLRINILGCQPSDSYLCMDICIHPLPIHYMGISSITFYEGSRRSSKKAADPAEQGKAAGAAVQTQQNTGTSGNGPFFVNRRRAESIRINPGGCIAGDGCPSSCACCALSLLLCLYVCFVISFVLCLHIYMVICLYVSPSHV